MVHAGRAPRSKKSTRRADSPPHGDTGCPSCLHDGIKPLETLLNGAVDVLFGEELRGGSEDAHFLGTSSHLSTPWMADTCLAVNVRMRVTERTVS